MLLLFNMSSHNLLLLMVFALILIPELLLPLLLSCLSMNRLFNNRCGGSILLIIIVSVEILCDRVHYLFLTLELLATRALLLE